MGAHLNSPTLPQVCIDDTTEYHAAFIVYKNILVTLLCKESIEIQI